MSPRRSRFQIAIDVLTVIQNGETRPTRIMYAANLSWNSLKTTLELLINKGYVDEEHISERKKQYFINSKGNEVLRYYNNVESIIQIT